MRRSPGNSGYTLIEVVVAIIVFGIGGLALVGSSAVIAGGMGANAVRERAGRIASSRLEVLESQCRASVSGRESAEHLESDWSVTRIDSNRVGLVESVTFMAPHGARTVSYSATIPCPQ